MVMLVCCIGLNKGLRCYGECTFIDIEFWVMVWIMVTLFFGPRKKVCTRTFQHVIGEIFPAHDRRYVDRFFNFFDFCAGVKDALCLFSMFVEWRIAFVEVQFFSIGRENVRNTV